MTLSRGDESLEARFEVRDQVLWILEAGVNADAQEDVCSAIARTVNAA